MPTKEEDITIKSKQVTAILGTPPQWLIRWGSMSVLLIVLLVLALCAFITYPQTINASTFIVLPDTNRVVSAGYNCKFYRLLVEKDYQLVNNTDPVMITMDFHSHYDTILAGATGKFLSTRLFSPGDTLLQGEQLFTLMPTTRKTDLEIMLSPAQVLKTMPGLNVVISLPDDPQEIYGALKGKILTRPFQHNNMLVCRVKLSTPWPSQLENSLFVHKEIKADLTLITGEQTLLNRMLSH